MYLFDDIKNIKDILKPSQQKLLQKEIINSVLLEPISKADNRRSSSPTLQEKFENIFYKKKWIKAYNFINRKKQQNNESKRNTMKNSTNT